MKHLKSMSLALAVAAVVAGAAIAAPQSTQGTRAKIASNGDGAIDRAEAAAHPRLAEHFDRLDTNRDGRIDRSERPKHRGGKDGRGRGGIGDIVKLDTDKDGRISRAEAADSRLAQRFDALDANRDGYVVRREMEAGMQRLKAERTARHRQQATERFQQADRNRDGRLTRDEVGQAMPRLVEAFAYLDDNRDGFLSADEIRSTRGGPRGR